MRIACALAGLIALMITASSAWSLGDQECDPGGKQSQMNACAIEWFKTADRELNRVYKQLMSSLSEEDQKPLLTEQRAWLKKRDPKCVKEANDEAEGGSMWPMVYDSCREATTKIRINKLKRWKQ